MARNSSEASPERVSEAAAFVGRAATEITSIVEEWEAFRLNARARLDQLKEPDGVPDFLWAGIMAMFVANKGFWALVLSEDIQEKREGEDAAQQE